jgi:hypothetical protein
MEECPSIFVDPNNYYSFTCENCFWRGDREALPDYVTLKKGMVGGQPVSGYVEVGKYPHRCRECERQKKRYSRMRDRCDKIFSIAETQSNKYRLPKFLTFGYPCEPVDTHDFMPQLLELKKKIGEAKKVLGEHGVKGGVYVYEVTSRELEDGRWKHHPHVHALVIAPKVPKKRLPQFCEQLMNCNSNCSENCTIHSNLGLGRINYFAPSGSHEQKVRSISNYISKYMCKDLKQRCATWGIYRGFNQQSS